jgi:hypothetical protein
MVRIADTRLLLAGLLAAGCAVAPPPQYPGIRVYEGPQAITEGETTLAVDPDTAYAAATDYPRWTAMFADIQEVHVTAHDGDDARVTLVHAAGNRDNVHFHNRPATRVVWFEDTGGSAEVWAEIAFIPGDRPGTTRVHSRIFADVHGFASIFVTDNRLRGLREQRIHDDLVQLRTYFAGRLAAD